VLKDTIEGKLQKPPQFPSKTYLKNSIVTIYFREKFTEQPNWIH